MKAERGRKKEKGDGRSRRSGLEWDVVKRDVYEETGVERQERTEGGGK